MTTTDSTVNSQHKVLQWEQIAEQKLVLLPSLLFFTYQMH